MSEKQIETIEGTLVKTLYTTVEKGTLTDGTKYEKKQATAPRTLTEAVTDSDGKRLNDVLEGMQIQLDKATIDIKAGVNDVIDERVKNDVALKSEFVHANLLKNSNFRLNSNTQSLYSAGSSQDIETCDEWHIVTGSNTTLASVAVLDDGVKYSVENGGFFSNFCQWLDNPRGLAGKSLTFSFEVSDVNGTGSGYYVQVRNSDTYVVICQGYFTSAGRISATVTIPENALDIIVGFNCNGDGASGSVIIRWVKVEVGTISTDYIVPDAEIEKVRCGQAIMNHGSNYMTPYPIMNGINIVQGAWLDTEYGKVYCALSFDKPDGSIHRFQIGDSLSNIMVYDYDGNGNWSEAGSIQPDTVNTSRFITNTSWDCPVILVGSHPTELSRVLLGFKTSYEEKTNFILFNNYGADLDQMFVLLNNRTTNELGQYEIWNGSNSNPVSISTTAPANTACLWIDTVSMKTKIYKDGAWTIVA